MGLTAIAIIYSPWGKQSGAHLNPAVTFTFFRLGRLNRGCVFYIVAQFLGGRIGAGGEEVLREAIADPAVELCCHNSWLRWSWSCVLQVIISFGLMLMVLFTSNNQKLAPLFAGILVATYITLEAPLSGTSMNPARTLPFPSSGRQSGFTSQLLLGMLLAEVYVRLRGRKAVIFEVAPSQQQTLHL